MLGEKGDGDALGQLGDREHVVEADIRLDDRRRELRAHEGAAEKPRLVGLRFQHGLDGSEPVIARNRLQGHVGLQLLLQGRAEDIEGHPDARGLAQRVDQPQGLELRRRQGEPDRHQARRQGVTRQSQKRPPIEFHDLLRIMCLCPASLRQTKRARTRQHITRLIACFRDRRGRNLGRVSSPAPAPALPRCASSSRSGSPAR